MPQPLNSNPPPKPPAPNPGPKDSGPPNPKSPNSKKPPDLRSPAAWGPIIGYIVVSLLMLWIWQDMYSAGSVRTIAYSTFKSYLAHGEVTECSIQETEIDGHIVPKPGDESPQVPTAPEKPAATTSEKSPTATTPAAKSASNAANSNTGKPEAPAEKPAAEQNGAQETATQKAAAQKSATEKTATHSADAEKNPTEPFDFRTVRVDDPQLVQELEAHHVKFKGVRPELSFDAVPLVDFAAGSVGLILDVPVGPHGRRRTGRNAHRQE